MDGACDGWGRMGMKWMMLVWEIYNGYCVWGMGNGMGLWKIRGDGRGMGNV